MHLYLLEYLAFAQNKILLLENLEMIIDTNGWDGGLPLVLLSFLVVHKRKMLLGLSSDYIAYFYDG